MKADEVRLYALRGGLKKQSVCYTHFHSNKVFRGDHKEFFDGICVLVGEFWEKHLTFCMKCDKIKMNKIVSVRA